MIKLVRNFTKKTTVRYLLAGGTSFLVEMMYIYSSMILLGTSKTTAVAVSFWIGLLVSYYLQKVFAFSNRRRDEKYMLDQVFLYSFLVVVNYIFTITFIYILRDIDIAIARTIALIITTLWNYYYYKKVLFKN